MNIRKIPEIAGDAWHIENLLTAQECEDIRTSNDQIGSKQASGDRRNRDCCSDLIHDQKLAEKIWSRLKGELGHLVYDLRAEDLPPGFKEDTTRDLLGTWKPIGVHEHFTLLFYKASGHFGPHRDSFKQLSDDVCSFLTVSVYLADRPGENVGGGTNFLRDDLILEKAEDDKFKARTEDIVYRNPGKKGGSAIVFQHDVMHEGEELAVDSPPKWLLVTQVMFERAAESAPVLTDEQQKARIFLREAEEAEMDGRIQDAIKLYNKAYRLDRSLEG